jgi:cephalosporin-C deacetylase-like acetyl esterase
MQQQSSFDRRSVLAMLGATGLANVIGKRCFAADLTQAKALLPPLNRFPTMLQQWLEAQMLRAEAIGAQRREVLHTKADALRYVETAKLFIRECFGPLPEKTPLNAQVTGKLERDTYTIEKVVFESRPGYLVTSNLYVPKGQKFPLPGVVGVCGHSMTGKAIDAYQSFAQGLARQGYVVLIFDPVGQGERVQWPTSWGKSGKGGSTGEHIQLGNQMSLLGEFIGTWFAWDAIRALDYLLTREEVDPQHIGVTGNSGGGTQTTWLAALDDRWTMAAPACFVTTFRRNAENELPADTEQCPPRVLSFGLDHSDFIACLAPKPVILLTQEKDFFDVRGGKESFDRLKKLYTLLGKPENIRLQVGPDPHGYTQPNREAMYAFFNEITGVSATKGEPALSLEKDEDLWCTPHGDVAELGSRKLADLTKEQAQDMAVLMKEPRTEPLASRLGSTLRIGDVPDAAPDYRILRSVGTRQYPSKGYCDYAVAVEDQIEIIVTRLCDEAGFTSRPPKGIKQALLYVSHRSADAELREEPLIADLLKAHPDAAFYACDVRGIGESQPNTCGANTFDSAYGNHYFYAAHGVMLDRPLLGQRTFDLIRIVQWLKECGHEEVHVVGKGWGALPAAFVALLDARVKGVTLKHALTSYADIAADADYRWPYALLLPGALPRIDLPEVYAALAQKGLNMIAPWTSQDGMNA